MDKEVYRLIDDVLSRCNNPKGLFGLPFDRSSTAGSEAIALMIEHNLVDFHTNEVAAIKVTTIKNNGRKVIETGGFEKWLSNKENSEKKIKELEIEKLKYDVRIAKRIFKTYWWTFIMALIGFLLSIFLGIKQLLEKPTPPPANTQSLVKPSNVSK